MSEQSESRIGPVPAPRDRCLHRILPVWCDRAERASVRSLRRAGGLTWWQLRGFAACLVLVGGVCAHPVRSSGSTTDVLTIYGRVFIGSDKSAPSDGYSVEVSISHDDGGFEDLTYRFDGTEQGKYALSYIDYSADPSTFVAAANDWVTAVVRDAAGHLLGADQGQVPEAAIQAHLWQWDPLTAPSSARATTWGQIKRLWQ